MQTPHQTVSVQALRNTRLVEGLRVDEPKPSISPDALYEVIGPDPAPIAVDVRRPTDPGDASVGPVLDLPAAFPRKSSSFVYCDNEQEVREGFAIALRAMGVEANFLRAVIVPPATSSNREDN
jgi:hypothetical protein